MCNLECIFYFVFQDVYSKIRNEKCIPKYTFRNTNYIFQFVISKYKICIPESIIRNTKILLLMFHNVQSKKSLDRAETTKPKTHR